MSEQAVIDSTLSAHAAPNSTGEGTRVPLRVDGFGAAWTRPHIVAGAQAVASAAHTVTANTAALTVPDGASKINIFIDITAVGGDADETLDIAVEWSPDAGTTWHVPETADTFTQLLQTAGAQALAKQFTVLAPTYRLALTLGGTTPSFTFAIDHVGVYA